MELKTIFALAITAVSLMACGASASDDGSNDGETQDELRKSGTGAPCGGIAGLACKDGFVCVDKPGDSCDPAKGGRDCSGTCQAKPKMCGGFAGIQCPSGQACVDDPTDSCDPKHGGADCSGICK